MQNTQQSESESYQSSCTVIEPTRTVPDLAADVRAGLLNPPRTLPPKYFYDERGSQLFEQICETPEYYPTRTEDSLLQNYSKHIIERAQPVQILELGSGNAQKTRRIFDACEQLSNDCEYVPFDVCEKVLEQTAKQLQANYDWLNVFPLVGDYHAGLANLPDSDGVRLFVFLGSTIGNFTPQEAAGFITEIKQCMKPGDFFLLGADRIKNTEVLDAAYNDAEGLTAEFNLNVLRVINRELGANFDVSGFEHCAKYNESKDRIEMHLIANSEQHVHISDLNEIVTFKPGDAILTEVSHKYTSDGIEKLLQQCGLNIIEHYEPDNQYFSLILAQYSV